ncbi:MAG: iron-containing alcohol dehydrogenase [Ruminococcaceae bacterium]|nr:iron-containing alcohol dehydrogenase [Oscillospiraceae bacterium]
MEQRMLNSFMPVKVICGENCVKLNSEVWKKAGNKCLLVTGKSGAIKSGALTDVCFVLDQLHIEYYIFSDINENPTVESCYEAGKLARDFGVDFVVGIGGGSAQDASKAVAIFAADENLDCESIYTRNVPAKHLPVYLVGTTAGTGSEVTGVSVLSDSNGFKKSISGADCYAVASFCDAKYTVTADYNITVSTALDAYAHALESYFASTANDISELFALKALNLLWGNLKKLQFDKKSEIDLQMRNELYAASLYAGLAINVTGTAFPHTAGYILTEKFNVPHGKACTAFHPQLLEKAEKYRPEKLRTVCCLFNASKNEINAVISSLTDVHIEITREEAEVFCSRWATAVKNFERTPGGYTPQEAVDGLLMLVL